MHLRRVELYRGDDPDGFVRVVPRRNVQVVVHLHRHLGELLELPRWQVQSQHSTKHVHRLWRREMLRREWGNGREHVLGMPFRRAGELCKSVWVSRHQPLPCFCFCVLGHRILLSSPSLCSRRWRCRFGKSDSGSFRWTCGERVVDGRSSEAASDRVCDNLQQIRWIRVQVNRCRNQGWGCKRIQWKHGMRNNLYSRCRKQKD